MAIALVNADEEQFYFHGIENESTNRPVDQDTPFEIGSITKVFTATLLGKFAHEGRVDLDSPAQSALPDGVSLPKNATDEITFRQLSNHRSGLKRLPSNLGLSKDTLENPYASYTTDQLYEYLNSQTSNRRLGAVEAYSNLGTGLLGHLLGRIDQSDFATALRTHILGPLGLSSTAVELPAELHKRLAQPHESKGKKTSPWDFQDATVAAGGLKSTLRDMTAFLKANLKPNTNSTGEAIALTHQPSVHDIKNRPMGWTDFFLPLLFVALAIFGIWYFQLEAKQTVLIPAVGFAPLFSVFFCRWWSVLIASVSIISFCVFYFGDAFQPILISVVCLFWVHISFQMESKRRSTSKGHLAWQTMPIGEYESLWHNGMVGGSASFIGFVPAQKKGVVILTNVSLEVDSLGQLLLLELTH